ncbi:MAG TPA: hypothetical protein VHT02_04755 [Methylocella sp.]|nr:hypothetical protein [Methylocella sp.]
MKLVLQTQWPPCFPETFVPPNEVRNKSCHPSGVLELHVEPSALPKSVDGGNLGCNKLVIRWLPV